MTNDGLKRLQKFLSEQGICSRRTAEELVRAGKIFINGKKALLGDKVSGEEEIVVNGKKVERQEQKKIVFVFHKPLGVESTLKNEHGGKTLANFDFGQRVFPIGRLDKNSRGLLLLTNDGELCNRLAHPRYEHEKEYIVQVDKPLTPETCKKLSNGSIKIDRKLVQKCEIVKEGAKTFRMVLREGRNRQIRRMCDACGLTVLDLFRIRVGRVQLRDLKEGEWRVLTQKDIL